MVGLEWPSQRAKVTTDSPASRMTEAYVCRSTWKPSLRDAFHRSSFFRMGMTPAVASAGLHTSTLKMFARMALPYVVVMTSGNFFVSRSGSGPHHGSSTSTAGYSMKFWARAAATDGGMSTTRVLPPFGRVKYSRPLRS